MKIHPVKPWKGGIRFGKRHKQERLELPHRKKKRLIHITFLPSFITLLNGACGFIAIVFASRNSPLDWTFSFVRDLPMNSFILAAHMIFLAMIADVLDGRVARLTRSTSSFGGQLDSLSDTISFGVAPAFLMLKLVEFQFEQLHFENLRLSLFISRVIFFSAIFYAMCTVLRLARFNVENEEDESAHMNFYGLPSPAAAGVVASLIVFYQQFFSKLTLAAVLTLPLVTVCMGILMVSRVRYPHLANQLFRSKKTLSGLLAIFAAGIFVVWNIHLALLLGFCGFALFGIFRWIFSGLAKKAPKKKKALKNQNG